MGPLRGIRIIEIAGVGPAPMCAMILADLGADVVCVDRIGGSNLGIPMPDRFNLLRRSRRSIAIDLKRDEGRRIILRLAEDAHVLIEGFRPGVAERLGIGPDACRSKNPRLVYGRMTGWGQDGPLARAAGHDTNYIALAGALHPIGPADEPPVLPLNLVGDFGGGALYLAVGILAGLLEARSSGRGQVVDAAMIDGAANLTTVFHGLLAADLWSTTRGENLLDGSAPFIATYRTRDGKFISVCALEPKFFAELVRRLGLDEEVLDAHANRAAWPALRKRFADVFGTRTRDEWCAALEGSEACFAPVLDLHEVAHHPHHRARSTFVEVDGITQPAPAPRFDRTPGHIRLPPPCAGEHTTAILRECGFAESEIEALTRDGIVA